jgi:hypothetical protein
MDSYVRPLLMSNLGQTYSDIIKFCEETKPSLIYLAVGCSQSHYPRDKASPQEYPPFVEEWAGNKVCILIDPLLEQPPYCFSDLGVTDQSLAAVVDIKTIRFYCLRQRFETMDPPSINSQYCTPSHVYEADMAFLYSLCDLACRSQTKFIYQDYSGRITDYLYPIMRYQEPERLKANVLFDVTYNEGGCFVDFTKVKILKKPNGDFLHPEYEVLANLRSHPSLMEIYAKKRRSVLGSYIHWYYQILLGNKPEREWCTADTILPKMVPLCRIYGTPIAPDKASIYALLKTALVDYCAATNHYLTETEVAEIVQKPDQYLNTLALLCTE